MLIVINSYNYIPYGFAITYLHNEYVEKYILAVELESVFPVKFQIRVFLPLCTEKWGYKEQNRGTKQKN